MKFFLNILQFEASASGNFPSLRARACAYASACMYTYVRAGVRMIYLNPYTYAWPSQGACAPFRCCCI